jgi:hypothetical protein
LAPEGRFSIGSEGICNQIKGLPLDVKEGEAITKTYVE